MDIKNLFRRRILGNIFLALMQIANMFCSNIAVSEVANGKPFPIMSILKNAFFWVVVLSQFAYNIIGSVIKRNDIEHETSLLSDRVKAKKYERILETSVRQIENGDTQGAKETAKMIKYLDDTLKRR